MIKKIDTEDIQKLKKIQNEYNQLVFDMGEFYFEKLQIMKDIEMKEVFIKELEEEFNKSNSELTDYLTKKYGTGKINLESGEIENF